MFDDHDEVLTCPNNPAHRVSQSRMQFHMAKCNHVATNVPAVCRFNSAHQMLAINRDTHEKTCPDRKVVELGIINKDTGAAPVVMKYVAPKLPPSEESWEEVNVPTYDPALKTLNTPVLRSLQGATKSERKHHRKMERERHQQITDGNFIPSLAPAAPQFEVTYEEPKPAYDYSKSLRAPATKSKTFDVPAQGRGMGLGRGRVPAQNMPGLGMGRGAEVDFPHLQRPNNGHGFGEE